jgi:hypothetical protein
MANAVQVWNPGELMENVWHDFDDFFEQFLRARPRR